MSKEEVFISPLAQRYASSAMVAFFTDENRYLLWRRLWIALAEAQHELGLPITQKQIDELKARYKDLNLDDVRRHELRLKHDVMAHIHAFGDLCPEALPILHMGATSCYVTDNADILIQRDALRLLQQKLVTMTLQMAQFAEKYSETPCIGQTHLQPAQPTTVGKRACLWIQDLLMDLEQLLACRKRLALLGCKGATGTQSAMLRLFQGDETKVEKLDRLLETKLGVNRTWLISGQTYPRKYDSLLGKTLSGIAISAHKFATDIRLLSSQGDTIEGVSEDQVGSSAMPHKRNPIFSERICSLARYAISLAENLDYTASLQWLERSLDDSANRRLVLPQLFLTVDALLELMLHVVNHLVVDQERTNQRLQQHLGELVLEQVLMLCTSRGLDRQKIHKHLRGLVTSSLKGDKELLTLLAEDSQLNLSLGDLDSVTDQGYLLGLAQKQVKDFLTNQAYPTLQGMEKSDSRSSVLF